MTTPAQEFVLRHVVRDVLDSTSEADPGRLAETVLARIAGDDREVALAQAMRLFVRQVISENRTAHRPSNVRPLHRGSLKVGAIRDGWQRRLRDRVHVGNSAWKQLADCTYDDLVAAATERQQLADRNAAWARDYRSMASAVLDADVDTFGALPTDQLMHILGGAA